MHKILLMILFFSTTSQVLAQSIVKSKERNYSELNSALLELFDRFPIVAVGEGQHNSALTFEWLNTLIREEDFPSSVDNIVVEFGASEYQSVMDDFVNGRNVPDSLLKKCWRETTQIMVWDNPIYEQFFVSIRERNSMLPEDKRIRVLLGDPSFGSIENRDEHAYRIIEEKVLNKNQTALLIFGDLHFVKRDVFTNYAPAAELKTEFINVVQFLEINYPGKCYSVWGSVNTKDSITNSILESENIQLPALISASGSKLGEIDFRIYYPYPTDNRTDNLGNDIDTSKNVQLPIRQIVDGIIYRGSWEEQNYLAPRPDHIYSDTVYLNELIRREKTVNIPPYRIRLYFYKIFESVEFLPFENALDNDRVSTVDTLYQSLMSHVPEELRMDVLNHTGYFYLRKKDFLRSIKIFKLAVRKYPDDPEPYTGLGDAYKANKEKGNALKCYEDALIRDPGNASVKDRLDQLK